MQVRRRCSSTIFNMRSSSSSHRTQLLFCTPSVNASEDRNKDHSRREKSSFETQFVSAYTIFDPRDPRCGMHAIVLVSERRGAMSFRT